MANYDAMRQAPAWHEKVDVPQMETRPVPNVEQHRSFQLACRHRDLNDRYARLLDEFDGALDGLRHVLDSGDSTGQTVSAG